MVVEGEKSKHQPTTAGVPQGSILGPTLFILYINDIVDLIGPNVRLYADDVTTYIAYDHPDEATAELQTRIDTATKWAERWLIIFNPAKTESLIFSRKKDQIKPQLTIQNTPILDVEAHKHLGLTVQKNGKWSEQIKEMVQRAQKRVDILRGHMFTLDRRSLEKLYIT